MGWSYGFKSHLVINHLGEIVSLKLTKGNVDDRAPVAEMADDLLGRLIAHCLKDEKPSLNLTVEEKDMLKSLGLVPA